MLSAFYVSDEGWRRRLLLIVSYVFYAANAAAFIVLLVLISLVSYYGGKLLALHRKPAVLALLVFICALPLLLLKAIPLIGGAIPGLSSVAALTAGSFIPIGISFYTLQAISYVVDIYRRHGPPSSDLETHALFLAFFPYLLAGPIERGRNLIPQVRHLATPSPADLYVGGKIILWGYFCKLVVADNIGGTVDRLLAAYSSIPTASIAAAFYLYSFQIYFDFFGYSLIAIGLGRTLGIRLTPNFSRPYLAASLREFWRRWHITLSLWLRDYVYRPLGGRRNGFMRFASAIVVTFLVSGLWHGASFNFLLWGGVHAILFIATEGGSRIWTRLGKPLPAYGVIGLSVLVLQTFLCFSAVSFAWLFFRVGNWRDIAIILSRFADWISIGAPIQLAAQLTQPEALVMLGLLASVFAIDSWGVVHKIVGSVPRRPRDLKLELAAMNFAVVLLFLFGDLGTREFIYFGF